MVGSGVVATVYFTFTAAILENKVIYDVYACVWTIILTCELYGTVYDRSGM